MCAHTRYDLERVGHPQCLGFTNEGPKESSAALSLPPARAPSVDLTFAAETNRNWKPKSVSLVLRPYGFLSEPGFLIVKKNKYYEHLSDSELWSYREGKDCKENIRSLLGGV